MEKIAINFQYDADLIERVTPVLANVHMEINYFLDNIISEDENLYLRKYGKSLVHTERDRIVGYMAEYLIKPLRAALGTTYIHDMMPETLTAILEDIRGKVDSDEVIANIEVDFQGLEFECTVIEDGEAKPITMNATDLIDETALAFLQTKLKNLYKSVVEEMMKAIERAVSWLERRNDAKPWSNQILPVDFQKRKVSFS